MKECNDSQCCDEQDSWLSIEQPVCHEIKILGSRFLGYAFPMDTEEQFSEKLVALRKEHFNATHHCSAFRIRMGGEIVRFNDDGEPSGTAGKRILGSLEHFELTNIGFIVVRYFGGTKLGVGGLARAYSEVTTTTLETASIIRRYLMETVLFQFPFNKTSQVHHILDSVGATIIERAYGATAQYFVSIRASKSRQLREALFEQTASTVRFLPSPK